VKDVPDPSASASSSTATATVVDVVEKAGVVDMRYDSPPSSDAVVGLYCYSPDVFDVIRGLEPSSRGELEITDVNRTTPSGRACLPPRQRLVGGRGNAGVARRDRRADRRTGVNKLRDRGLSGSRCALRGRARLVRGAPRESLLPKPTRQTNVSFSRRA
jgi:hypothetical protein